MRRDKAAESKWDRAPSAPDGDTPAVNSTTGPRDRPDAASAAAECDSAGAAPQGCYSPCHKRRSNPDAFSKPQHGPSSAGTSSSGSGGGAMLLFCWWLPCSGFFCGPIRVTTVPLLVCSLLLLIATTLLSWTLLRQQLQHQQHEAPIRPGLADGRLSLGAAGPGEGEADALEGGLDSTGRKRGQGGEGRHHTWKPLTPQCNLYEGRWVRDRSYPLYRGKQCAWLAKNWACRFGADRPSFAFEKYRWQPFQCDLPRFNASDFLARMRHKVVAFVGDSLGQQQFQSLMCMLDPRGPMRPRGGQHAPDPTRARDVGDRFGFVWIKGTRRPTGWAYLFPATNTTVLFRWSTCLCHIEPTGGTPPPPPGAAAAAAAAGGEKDNLALLAQAAEKDMHLDRPDPFLVQHLPHMHLLVLNTGHHWNRMKLKDHHFMVEGRRLPEPGGRGRGRRQQEQAPVSMGEAHTLTMKHLTKWLDSALLSATGHGADQAPGAGAAAAGGGGGGAAEPGPLVMLRARSPRHFLDGEWNSGGRCDHISSPLKAKQLARLTLGSDPAMEAAVLGVPLRPGQAHSVQFLNISHMSSWRADAHPSKWDYRGTGVAGQDCLHWCLPGIPDVWNEVLYARLALHQDGYRGQHQSTREHGQEQRDAPHQQGGGASGAWIGLGKQEALL